MARTTAFTGAIVARMIARGDIKATGFVTPEKLIRGQVFDRFMDKVSAVNMRLEITTEKVKTLS